jgi:hypothetical protein
MCIGFEAGRTVSSKQKKRRIYKALLLRGKSRRAL